MTATAATLDPAYGEYRSFLEKKVKLAEERGYIIDPSEINPLLKEHQRAAVQWAVAGGCRAIFAAFGLGKSMMQFETVRIIRSKAGGLGLIVIPLNVRQEFEHDAKQLGIRIKFIRRIEEVEDEETLYLTNYETVRDGKLDPALFSVASLDEASCLRGFGGTKTFREFMRLFTGDAGPGRDRNRTAPVRHRFVATATPSPNDYIELLAYAAFLGIMDVAQAKTRFFKRDSTQADTLTLHAHREQDFWLWVASWALFIQKPSDLGFSDEGYDLPPLEIHWHEVASDHASAGTYGDGQGKLFREASLGVMDAAAEKRDSLDARLSKLLELRELDPSAHRILWHDLEREREALEAAIPGLVSVYGTQPDEGPGSKHEAITGFSAGRTPELAGKPCMLGSGCNFQRHCAWAIFLGIGFKFNDLIQAIHRLYRFLQSSTVRVDLIYTEAERGVREILLRKWADHTHQIARMQEIIKEYGLSGAAMAQVLTRKLGVERVEVTGTGYHLANNDNVLECRGIRSNSIGLVLTSIPFASQYEYSPNYADFGHCDSPADFFRQMDFLTPELFRALMPGRIAAIHVKDRIVPGGMTGLGFQTLYPFHADCIAHYQKHGFALIGMKTIVTDVVRENKQTNRLGWTEQCKDGSRMGTGVPEHLLIFRKPQTDREKGYADLPVRKDKSRYTRSRWQVDAHGFTRSSGDRLLTPEELQGLNHGEIFRLFRKHSLEQVYNFEHHVTLSEGLEQQGKLPSTFMLLQPQSWHDDVWTDVTRMRTLNAAQWSKGQQMHLCPFQFDIVDRAIEQYTNPGDEVLDPFGGIMTVPMRAVQMGRRGRGIELNGEYFTDGCAYVRAAAEQVSVPTLFDLFEDPTPGEKESEAAA